MGSPTSPQSARHHTSGTRETDLPTSRPTCLPQDNHRLGWATLLRHPIACLLPDQAGRSPEPIPEGIGRARTLSITGLDMVAPQRVREYQPVFHRLRLSASP